MCISATCMAWRAKPSSTCHPPVLRRRPPRSPGCPGAASRRPACRLADDVDSVLDQTSSLGGRLSPMRVDGHLCPKCNDAVVSEGAIGPSSMSLAMLDCLAASDDPATPREGRAGARHHGPGHPPGRLGCAGGARQ